MQKVFKFSLIVSVPAALLSSAAVIVLLRPGNAGLMTTEEPQATTRPGTFAPAPTATSWIIVPELPASATQADRGAEIYRLVCSSCHGDRGQGLTLEWRMTWNPKDQNCWQSKCHALNHPSDGFDLPHYIPAIIGPNTLGRFTTALDLYNYNHAAMPWYAPGSMIEAESWQVTAFLVRENGVDPIQTPLTPTKAARLLLHPGQSAMTTAPALQTEVWMARSWPWIGAVFLFICIASALYLRNKNVSRRRE